MPKGVHGRGGPPPNPNSARSEQRGGASGWTELPAEGRGRRARAPKFPLVGPTEVESEFWVVLWKKPQAVMWERLGLTFQVAAYARTFCEASMSNAPASLKTAVLRMEDMLGLTPDGMNRLRWRITADELAGQRVARRVEQPAPARRLRAAGE